MKTKQLFHPLSNHPVMLIGFLVASILLALLLTFADPTPIRQLMELAN